MKDVMPAPEVQDRAKQLGMAMRWSTPEDMTARLKADIAKWGAVIEQAGIAKRD
jgi:tripartite-type tricarboxylate transporter receptor subunit TctC